MNSIRWAIGKMGKQKYLLPVTTVMVFIGIALTTIQPFLFEAIIDNVMENPALKNPDMGIQIAAQLQKLTPILIAICAVFLSKAVVDYTSYCLREKMGLKTQKNMRSELYSRLQSQTSSFYSGIRTGDLMTRLTGDLDVIKHFLSWNIGDVVYAVVLLAASLVILFSINAWLTLSLMVIAPITFILTFTMSKSIRRAYSDAREESTKLNTLVQENISGNRVVRAFTREKFETEKFQEQNNKFKDSHMRAARIWFNYEPYLNGINQALNILTFLIGGIFVIKGYMTVGNLSVFLGLIWAINEPLSMAGNLINEIQRFFSSCEKVQWLFWIDPTIKDPEHPVEGHKITGDVEFKNITFSYDGAKVLDNISIHAKSGQTIGIMGSTGSGKTTLFNLMMRSHDPTDGVVLLDGVDVKSLRLEELRKNIGVAMQDVFLFSETVDTNISYGNPDADESFIKKSAKIADADGFITKMSQGYETIIGERGVGLSGGQRQRIALARALAYDTPILLIDDTTSAVDMETETYIQEQLKNRDRKATTFVIAQRISSVKDADCIYILEDGKITEQGTHKELLKNRGYYYSIYALQQGIEEEVQANG